MKRLKLWLWWLRNGRDRLEMAWGRIEALEQQNSKLAAALLDQKKEIENLRRLVTAKAEDTKTPPRQARTWREVQNFVGAGEAHANG